MGDGENQKSKLPTKTQTPNRKAVVKQKLFRSSLAPHSVFAVTKKMTMMDKVTKAINVVGLPKRGASLLAIKKYISANSEFTSQTSAAAVKKAILKGIENGIISRPSHCKDAHGVAGSFILAPTSKKVKNAPKEKEIIQKAVKSQESNSKVIKPSKENVKKQKPIEKMEDAVKKISKKNVKSETGTAAKKTKKNILLSPAITKNVTKKNPVASKISKKGTKKDMGSLPKRTTKKGSKTEPLTSNIDKNKFIFTESESEENSKRPDQEPEIPKRKGNKAKVLHKEKVIKTNEQPKVKDPVSNNIEEESEVFYPKKGKEKYFNTKDAVKQSKTNPEPLEKYELKTKTKAITGNRREDLDVTRKDMSDTELDKRRNRPKSLKSYASDTELEISKRTTPQSKKIKPERKTLTKKFEKMRMK